jgi:DNA (cytosine-5)-methyltransferase 1
MAGLHLRDVCAGGVGGVRKLRLLDLFSGQGGFSLGLERTGGFETVAFCERDTHAKKVLAHRFPGVPIYDDVCCLTAETLARENIAVDAITAGFPCQDASIANQGGTGADGSRTGLFVHAVRLGVELGCQLLFLENVPELLNRGFGSVLGTLAENGFDAQWGCVSASALGADHPRERLFIMAYPSGKGRERPIDHESLFVSALEAFPQHGDNTFDEWQAMARSSAHVCSSDGLSVAMERRRLFLSGNSLVPLKAELLGRAYLESIEVLA